ncbi:MAG: hypothetical protein ACE5FY_00750 [Nitrospiria bacterium]
MGKTVQATAFIFLWFLMLTLAGCGEMVSAGPSGVFVDSSTEAFLEKSFEETKDCTELKEGKFKDVSVIFMPSTFPCKHYKGGCSGEYVNPNLLKVGTLFVWRHEVIHYLLDLNTGDPDAAHKSTFFKTCT